MKKLILFVCILTAFNLSTVTAQKSDAFKWLPGVWKIKTPKGTISETWIQLNDSTLSGKSVFITAENDTIPQEMIELTLRNGEWSYNPVSFGQNNNQPVKFKVIFQKGLEFISENLAHDFPQRISYRKISDTLLLASIEGRKNGKFIKQNFDFTKN